MLIINAVIPPIPFCICVSSPLRKHTALMMTAILKIFMGQKKYFQSQLFANIKGMNGISDLYSV